MVYVLGWYGGSNLMGDWVFMIMFWLGVISGMNNGCMISNNGMVIMNEWSIDWVLLMVVMGMCGRMGYYIWWWMDNIMDNRMVNNGSSIFDNRIMNGLWNNRIIEKSKYLSNEYPVCLFCSFLYINKCSYLMKPEKINLEKIQKIVISFTFRLFLFFLSNYSLEKFLNFFFFGCIFDTSPTYAQILKTKCPTHLKLCRFKINHFFFY